MTTMIVLVGEQPIPNLLPIRYINPSETWLVYTKTTEKVATRLKKLISNGLDFKVTDKLTYRTDLLFTELQQKINPQNDLIFNLTGGTKMMAFSAFALAAETNSKFIYFQTEGRKSLLSQYSFQQGKPCFEEDKNLPPLITATDYLNAHLDGFNETGFSQDQKGQLTAGGFFEQQLYNVLKNHFDEILVGIRPWVADQIEIDLVIRCGNHVGIAEIKLSDKIKEEGPKKGLDQLAMAGRREYLGTYTTKFLITGSKITNTKIRTLAQEAKIKIIDGLLDRQDRISPADAKRLIDTIKTELCGH